MRRLSPSLRMVPGFMLALLICGCASRRVGAFKTALARATAVPATSETLCVATGQDDKARFRVTVTDDQGAIVSDVRVAALRKDGKGASPRVARAHTDEVGQAVLTLDQPGTFDVLAEAPGFYSSKLEDVQAAAACERPVAVRLKVRPPICVVNVR